MQAKHITFTKTESNGQMLVTKYIVVLVTTEF